MPLRQAHRGVGRGGGKEFLESVTVRVQPTPLMNLTFVRKGQAMKKFLWPATAALLLGTTAQG